MRAVENAATGLYQEGRDVLWYKGFNGIGDRLHHISTLIQVAERFGLPFVVDMRDGMFGEVGEDAFVKYFTCNHPLFLGSVSWEQLESETGRNWVPNDLHYFRAVHFLQSDVWCLSPLFKLKQFRGPLWKRARFVEWTTTKLALSRFRCFFNRHTLELLAPCGSRLPLVSEGKGQNWLFMEVVHSIQKGGLASVHIREDLRHEIEHMWSMVDLNPHACVAIHVRQTDKSRSSWWVRLLRQIERGQVYSSMQHLYLATDSHRVIEAFKRANMSQTLHLNPWIELGEGERPLHLSGDYPPEMVMKSALFDLWTLKSASEFVPTVNSSFSRVVKAWRQ
jgi:hypothetical protein